MRDYPQLLTLPEPYVKPRSDDAVAAMVIGFGLAAILTIFAALSVV